MATPTGIHVVAPSVVRVDETFSIGVKMLTDPFFAKGECFGPSPAVNGRFNLSPRGITYIDNVLPDWRRTVDIICGHGYDGPTAFSFSDGAGPYPGDERPIRRVGGMSFSTPGTKFISVQDPESGISGASNPLWVVEGQPDCRLFWGDIHSQTFFTDGLRSPEELYSFAREEAFLDIFALADHAEWLTDRQWEYFVGVTNDFYHPGRFVTLVGFEWTSHAWGHRNVYYTGESGPILRSTDPIQGQLEELLTIAEERGALVIPHHSANAAMGVDWSLGHNPEVERLVEIYSVWGNSERPENMGNPRPIRVLGGEKPGQHVVDALKMGRKFGFIGGGDIHDGRPGDELHSLQKGLGLYRDLYRQGIMGVWAAELTREGIFEALWNRRVFATTNVRLLLKFSIDGAPMGSDIVAQDRLNLEIQAVSENPIARVELVRNGLDCRCLEPHEREVYLELQEPGPPKAAWYYVRLTREDGEMGWSSPIWVSRLK